MLFCKHSCICWGTAVGSLINIMWLFDPGGHVKWLRAIELGGLELAGSVGHSVVFQTNILSSWGVNRGLCGHRIVPTSRCCVRSKWFFPRHPCLFLNREEHPTGFWFPGEFSCSSAFIALRLVPLIQYHHYGYPRRHWCPDDWPLEQTSSCPMDKHHTCGYMC